MRAINIKKRIEKLEKELEEKYFNIELEDGGMIKNINSHDIMEVFHEQLQAMREDREPEHELIDAGIFKAKQIPKNGLATLVVAFNNSEGGDDPDGSIEKVEGNREQVK